MGERFSSFLQQAVQETAGQERQALLAELEAARSELAAARSARAALTAERFSAEESRMKDYASEIRTLSHSNATLQAQCDMANAHLKALAAMARSTASQVRSRQALLYGLLQQTEDIETSTGEDCEEDPEERALKERLHRLSISCSKLSGGVKPSQHLLEGDRPALTTEVRTPPSVALGTERTAVLSEEAQRLSQEINQLEEAAASLEEMHDVSAPALLELQKLRLHIPGSSLASLEALVSQLHELASLEEEMRSCNRENRLNHLRQEVAERQSHFGRMTHDLQAQVSHLQEEVRAVEHRRSSASVNGELRELELLRQRELRHLRDQEEQLAQMERQDTDLSQPPEPLAAVDPVPDRLPRRMNPANQSQTRGDWQELSPTDIQFVQPRERANHHGFEGAPLQRNRTASDVFRRHSDFEERVSELKAVIGTSLQSLAEEGWLSSDSGK